MMLCVQGLGAYQMALGCAEMQRRVPDKAVARGLTAHTATLGRGIPMLREGGRECRACRLQV
eukprot:3550919-Rhodomonas_salina.1